MVGESIATPFRPTTPDTEAAEPELIPPDRLNTLADGVFAIAMTLLVLELGVPVATADNGELTELLVEMLPEFLIYGLSFLVLGVFWLVHSMIFEAIERSDTTLVWLNIVYLMFVALIPFSTALIGEQGAMTATALFYGANMLVLFFLGWATWSYATSGQLNVAGNVDPELVRGVKTMGLVYFGVFAVPLVLAFISPASSMIIYAIIVMAFIGFTVIGRGEAVTVWRMRHHSRPRT